MAIDVTPPGGDDQIVSLEAKYDDGVLHEDLYVIPAPLGAVPPRSGFLSMISVRVARSERDNHFMELRRPRGTGLDLVQWSSSDGVAPKYTIVANKRGIGIDGDTLFGSAANNVASASALTSESVYAIGGVFACFRTLVPGVSVSIRDDPNLLALGGCLRTGIPARVSRDYENLAVAKEIVRDLGSRLAVESCVGHGGAYAHLHTALPSEQLDSLDNCKRMMNYGDARREAEVFNDFVQSGITSACFRSIGATPADDFACVGGGPVCSALLVRGGLMLQDAPRGKVVLIHGQLHDDGDSWRLYLFLRPGCDVTKVFGPNVDSTVFSALPSTVRKESLDRSCAGATVRVVDGDNVSSLAAIGVLCCYDINDVRARVDDLADSSVKHESGAGSCMEADNDASYNRSVEDDLFGSFLDEDMTDDISGRFREHDDDTLTGRKVVGNKSSASRDSSGVGRSACSSGNGAADSKTQSASAKRLASALGITEPMLRVMTDVAAGTINADKIRAKGIVDISVEGGDDFAPMPITGAGSNATAFVHKGRVITARHAAISSTVNVCGEHHAWRYLDDRLDIASTGDTGPVFAPLTWAEDCVIETLDGPLAAVYIGTSSSGRRVFAVGNVDISKGVSGSAIVSNGRALVGVASNMMAVNGCGVVFSGGDCNTIDNLEVVERAIDDKACYLVARLGAGKTCNFLQHLVEIMERKEPGKTVRVGFPTLAAVANAHQYHKRFGGCGVHTGAEDIPNCRLMFYTSEVLVNEIHSGKVTADNTSLLIADEAHFTLWQTRVLALLIANFSKDTGVPSIQMSATPSDPKMDFAANEKPSYEVKRHHFGPALEPGSTTGMLPDLKKVDKLVNRKSVIVIQVPSIGAGERIEKVCVQHRIFSGYSFHHLNADTLKDPATLKQMAEKGARVYFATDAIASSVTLPRLDVLVMSPCCTRIGVKGGEIVASLGYMSSAQYRQWVGRAGRRQECVLFELKNVSEMFDGKEFSESDAFSTALGAIAYGVVVPESWHEPFNVYSDLKDIVTPMRALAALTSDFTPEVSLQFFDDLGAYNEQLAPFVGTRCKAFAALGVKIQSACCPLYARRTDQSGVRRASTPTEVAHRGRGNPRANLEVGKGVEQYAKSVSIIEKGMSADFLNVLNNADYDESKAVQPVSLGGAATLGALGMLAAAYAYRNKCDFVGTPVPRTEGFAASVTAPTERQIEAAHRQLTVDRTVKVYELDGSERTRKSKSYDEVGSRGTLKNDGRCGQRVLDGRGATAGAVPSPDEVSGMIDVGMVVLNVLGFAVEHSTSAAQTMRALVDRGGSGATELAENVKVFVHRLVFQVVAYQGENLQVRASGVSGLRVGRAIHDLKAAGRTGTYFVACDSWTKGEVVVSKHPMYGSSLPFMTAVDFCGVAGGKGVDDADPFDESGDDTQGSDDNGASFVVTDDEPPDVPAVQPVSGVWSVSLVSMMACATNLVSLVAVGLVSLRGAMASGTLKLPIRLQRLLQKWQSAKPFSSQVSLEHGVCALLASCFGLPVGAFAFGAAFTVDAVHRKLQTLTDHLPNSVKKRCDEYGAEIASVGGLAGVVTAVEHMAHVIVRWVQDGTASLKLRAFFCGAAGVLKVAWKHVDLGARAVWKACYDAVPSGSDSILGSSLPVVGGSAVSPLVTAMQTHFAAPVAAVIGGLLVCVSSELTTPHVVAAVASADKAAVTDDERTAIKLTRNAVRAMRLSAAAAGTTGFVSLALSNAQLVNVARYTAGFAAAAYVFSRETAKQCVVCAGEDLCERSLRESETRLAAIFNMPDLRGALVAPDGASANASTAAAPQTRFGRAVTRLAGRVAQSAQSASAQVSGASAEAAAATRAFPQVSAASAAPSAAAGSNDAVAMQISATDASMFGTIANFMADLGDAFSLCLVVDRLQAALQFCLIRQWFHYAVSVDAGKTMYQTTQTEFAAPVAGRIANVGLSFGLLDCIGKVSSSIRCAVLGAKAEVLHASPSASGLAAQQAANNTRAWMPRAKTLYTWSPWCLLALLLARPVPTVVSMTVFTVFVGAPMPVAEQLTVCAVGAACSNPPGAIACALRAISMQFDDEACACTAALGAGMVSFGASVLDGVGGVSTTWNGPFPIHFVGSASAAVAACGLSDGYTPVRTQAVSGACDRWFQVAKHLTVGRSEAHVNIIGFGHGGAAQAFDHALGGMATFSGATLDDGRSPSVGDSRAEDVYVGRAIDRPSWPRSDIVLVDVPTYLDNEYTATEVIANHVSCVALGAKLALRDGGVVVVRDIGSDIARLCATIASLHSDFGSVEMVLPPHRANPEHVEVFLVATEPRDRFGGKCNYLLSWPRGCSQLTADVASVIMAHERVAKVHVKSMPMAAAVLPDVDINDHSALCAQLEEPYKWLATRCCRNSFADSESFKSRAADPAWGHVQGAIQSVGRLPQQRDVGFHVGYAGIIEGATALALGHVDDSWETAYHLPDNGERAFVEATVRRLEQHVTHMPAEYDAATDYVASRRAAAARGVNFSVMTPDEVMPHMNSHGSVGFTSDFFGRARTLGEAMQLVDFWPRVESIVQAMVNGDPVNFCTNGAPKLEKLSLGKAVRSLNYCNVEVRTACAMLFLRLVHALGRGKLRESSCSEFWHNTAQRIGSRFHERTVRGETLGLLIREVPKWDGKCKGNLHARAVVIDRQTLLAGDGGEQSARALCNSFAPLQDNVQLMAYGSIFRVPEGITITGLWCTSSDNSSINDLDARASFMFEFNVGAAAYDAEVDAFTEGDDGLEIMPLDAAEKLAPSRFAYMSRQGREPALHTAVHYTQLADAEFRSHYCVEVLPRPSKGPTYAWVRHWSIVVDKAMITTRHVSKRGSDEAYARALGTAISVGLLYFHVPAARDFLDVIRRIVPRNVVADIGREREFWLSELVGVDALNADIGALLEEKQWPMRGRTLDELHLSAEDTARFGCPTSCRSTDDAVLLVRLALERAGKTALEPCLDDGCAVWSSRRVYSVRGTVKACGDEQAAVDATLHNVLDDGRVIAHVSATRFVKQNAGKHVVLDFDDDQLAAAVSAITTVRRLHTPTGYGFAFNSLAVYVGGVARAIFVKPRSTVFELMDMEAGAGQRMATCAYDEDLWLRVPRGIPAGGDARNDWLSFVNEVDAERCGATNAKHAADAGGGVVRYRLPCGAEGYVGVLSSAKALAQLDVGGRPLPTAEMTATTYKRSAVRAGSMGRPSASAVVARLSRTALALSTKDNAPTPGSHPGVAFVSAYSGQEIGGLYPNANALEYLHGTRIAGCMRRGSSSLGALVPPFAYRNAPNGGSHRPRDNLRALLVNELRSLGYDAGITKLPAGQRSSGVIDQDDWTPYLRPSVPRSKYLVQSVLLLTDGWGAPYELLGALARGSAVIVVGNCWQHAEAFFMPGVHYVRCSTARGGALAYDDMCKKPRQARQMGKRAALRASALKASLAPQQLIVALSDATSHAFANSCAYVR